MAYPDWRAGMKLKASLLRAMNVYQVIQAANLSRTSSTTPTATNLVIPAEANAVYEYTIRIAYAAGAGDASFTWSVPASASMQRHGVGIGTSAGGTRTNATTLFSSQGNQSTAMEVGGDAGAASANCSYFETGYLTTGSTAGNATLMFAQVSSSATASTVNAVSNLEYRRVG